MKKIVMGVDCVFRIIMTEHVLNEQWINLSLMSKYMNNTENRINDLIAYAKGILQGERGADLYVEYQEVLKQVNPTDVLTVVDELVKTGEDMTNIKRAVNKILNIFYEPVKRHGKARAEKGSFLFNLMAENMEKAESLVGEDLIFLMNENRELLLNYYRSKGVLVVDNLYSVEDQLFIDQTWTTEHYAEGGRKTIAKHVVGAMKIWYGDEYRDAGY